MARSNEANCREIWLIDLTARYHRSLVPHGRTAVLAAALASACSTTRHSARALPALEAGATGIAPTAMLANVRDEAWRGDATDPRVERVWRWRPADGTELLVWVACRGAGDGRACVATVGRAGDGGVAMLAYRAVGWSVPSASVGADRAALLLQGDDGRGGWMQTVAWDSASGSVVFERLVYPGGM